VELDAASPVSEGAVAPEPGNVSICLVCGGTMVFMDNLRLRAMTAEEWASLSPQNKDELLRMRRMVEYAGRSASAYLN
jgi:hypothetical protein